MVIPYATLRGRKWSFLMQPCLVRTNDTKIRILEIWQIIDKSWMNTICVWKSMKFRSNSPEGNHLKEKSNFNETKFFRHFINSSDTNVRIPEIWQITNKSWKNTIWDLKALKFRSNSPEGNNLKEKSNFDEHSFFRHFINSSDTNIRILEIWQMIDKSTTNTIWGLKSLKFRSNSPEGNHLEGKLNFNEKQIVASFH